MKIQDIGFLFVFAALLILRRPKLLLIAGLVSWILAIPLFATWVFFTGERLTWYGAAFIFASLLLK
jgi:ABC-type bacteriocin/lantibiotic exporter with double-glycine peptidase domain